MEPGKIVYQGKSKSGKDIIFRYPTKEDLQKLCDFINTISQEKVLILFQGEQISLTEEEKYLDFQLKGIADKKNVQLLAFSNDQLIGVSDVIMQNKATKHIGIFGIALAKEFRGEGIGTLLGGTVIKEAKRYLKGLKIIILSVRGNNEIAGKLYKKIGFIEYGNLPDGVFHQGHFVNQIYMYKKV